MPPLEGAVPGETSSPVNAFLPEFSSIQSGLKLRGVVLAGSGTLGRERSCGERLQTEPPPGSPDVSAPNLSASRMVCRQKHVGQKNDGPRTPRFLVRLVKDMDPDLSAPNLSASTSFGRSSRGGSFRCTGLVDFFTSALPQLGRARIDNWAGIAETIRLFYE